MSKFEIGKWYSWTQQGCYKHYGKVKTIPSSNTIYISPWIINQKTYDEEGCFDQQNSTDIKEISIDVVRQFLPVGHPDLEEVKGSSSTLTELPEKWFVRPRTEENLVLIKRHFKNIFNSYRISHEDNAYSNDAQYSTRGEEFERKYTEITFDQFKKWVLKEETVAQKSEEAPNSKVISPHSFIPKEGDQVQYVGNNLSDALGRKVHTVDKVDGHQVHLRGYSQKWVNIDWFKGPSPSITPQFTLIKEAQSTEQWTPKVGEWAVCKNNPGVAEEIVKVDQYLRLKGREQQCCHKENYRKALPHEIPLTMKDFDDVQRELTARALTEAKGDPSKLKLPTNESLLEEAKRRYPVGCKVKSFGYGEFVVDHHKEPKLVSGEVWIYGKLKGSNGDVYKNGHWAEIIEEPKTVGLGGSSDFANSGDILVGNGTSSVGVMNYTKGNSTVSYRGVEGISNNFKIYVDDTKWTPEKVIDTFKKTGIYFVDNSPTTQLSSPTDVKLPKALIMEAEDDNFNLITL